MSSHTQQDNAPQAVQDAWDSVTDSLSRFASIVRSMSGCENMIVSVCLRNDNRVDVYSLPAGSSGRDRSESEKRVFDQEVDAEIDDPSGKDLEDLSAKNMTKKLGSPTTRKMESIACSNTEDPEEIAMYLKEFSNQQLRAFLTDVRKRLKLKTFDWPHIARSRFQAEKNAPVPLAPGRANSGKTCLLHILKISMEVDDGWRIGVRESLDTFQRSHLKKQERAMIEPISESSRDNDCELQALQGPRNVIDDKIRGAIPDHVLEAAYQAPKDERKVIIPRHAWVSLSEFLSKICHPCIDDDTGWFIQHTPGDGNCMFSAILTAAKVRNCLPPSLDSVREMRSRLRKELIEVSSAGRYNSKYRRYWLASCLYDVDDTTVENYCYTSMEKALKSYRDEDLEKFLAPLRVVARNWADMVGGEHWGGLMRIELFIIASMCRAVIEVMQPAECSLTFASKPTKITNACDTRFGNRIVKMERRDIVHPHFSMLPSMNQRFMCPIDGFDSSSGWVRSYPVLRIFLSNSHYSAITSRYDYPIPPQEREHGINPMNSYRSNEFCLVEPFSVLTKSERDCYERVLELIRIWREASSGSAESGRHADSIIMQTKCTTLTVSMISHLEEPISIQTMNEQYLISDEIITCYMHLLQQRTNVLRNKQGFSGTKAPPQSHYMDSWFFKSILRGLSGPASKKKNSSFVTLL